jgi:hypothetical protein
MGLDGIEFVLACEEAFGINIPDSVAMQCYTPRDLINYIYSRIQKINDQRCLSQAGFYKIRQILIRDFGGNKKNIRPETEIATHLDDVPKAWGKLKNAIGGDNFNFPELTTSSAIARVVYGVLPITAAISMSYLGLPLVWLLPVMGIYYLIAVNVVFRMRRTIPKKYTQVKNFIPFVTCIKSTRWSEEAVLETVLEITAQQSGLNRDQFNEHSNFTKDIGFD